VNLMELYGGETGLFELRVGARQTRELRFEMRAYAGGRVFGGVSCRLSESAANLQHRYHARDASLNNEFCS
jgi:hypothetical protein